MSGDPIPIEGCDGWSRCCTFCEKRFPLWLSVNEENMLDKVPAKPGAFMFAFESKQQTEVVAIGMHQSNIQQTVSEKLQYLRQQISQKKLKETKSNILLRWTTFKRPDSKDACAIYAHWYNCGTLPRLVNEWPGEGVLRSTSHFEYCETSKKWCHLSKDPIWRKPKTVVHPHAVPKCKSWSEPCSVCDSRFTPWVNSKDFDNKTLPPKSPGIFMFAVTNNKGKREVVLISYTYDLKKYIHFSINQVRYTVEGKNFIPSTPEVRWTEVRDENSEESCYLYAHWHNASSKPLMMNEMLGEKQLAESEKFTLRNKDQQWCYEEVPVARLVKVNKSKSKRHILNSIDDELEQS